MKLKVCGITSISQSEELLHLNVDFLGFIFYSKSPRYVLNKLSLKEISEINHPNKIGVFVNEDIDFVVRIVKEANLNFIQLHGDEKLDYIEELKSKIESQINIIKVIRIGNSVPDFETFNRSSFIDYLLFDTDSQAFGGTGKSFEWNLLNKVKIKKPYFLSGGISEENINEVSDLKIQPFALDINSKFEISPGNKDTTKIQRFKKHL